MKKQSFIMSNQSGFFLSYTLFITTIIFIIITASIRTYQHEIEITHQLIDQLRGETLVQMGLAKFNQEYLPIERETFSVHYHLPDGEVTIAYSFIDDSEYRLHFTVITKNGLTYTTLKPIKSTSNIKVIPH